MEHFIGILLVLLVVAAIWMLVRAVRFRPPERTETPDAEPRVDRDRAVEHLREMIRCRTISTPELRREEEFERFRNLLPEFYPTLWEIAAVERVDTTGVLIRVPGREPGEPRGDAVPL